MILLIGVHSNIGAELGKRLLANNEPVRVFVRSEQSVAQLQSLGYEVSVGNLAEPETIRHALKGIDRMFLLTTPDADDVTWHTNAIEEAKQARVHHLVRCSLLGADAHTWVTFRRQHGLSDRYLEQSGIPYTILRPNYYMQNVTGSIIPSIDEQGQFYSSVGDARLSMVDTRDVATVAAQVLTHTGHLNKVYELTGPQALSYNDVAQLLSTSMGRAIRYRDVSLDTIRQTYQSYGMSEWLTNSIAELYQDYQISGLGGYAAQISHHVQEITGQPPSTLDMLLTEVLGKM